MWSGPRNLSTACMRSFANRPDCGAIDEPYYAAYLARSGRQHPMRDIVLRSQPTDWRMVERTLLGPAPDNAPLFYQKHMVQHMLPDIGRSWFVEARHAILIRHPARVLASFAARMDSVEEQDIGMHAMDGIARDIVAATGMDALIVEAEDIRREPEHVLGALCQALDIPFSRSMLAWAPGPRPEDGVWAEHWYKAVHASTGFTPPPDHPLPALTGKLAEILEETLPIYERLAARKISPSSG